MSKELTLISIQIDKNLLRQIKEKCQRLGISVSAYLRLLASSDLHTDIISTDVIKEM